MDAKTKRKLLMVGGIAGVGLLCFLAWKLSQPPAEGLSWESPTPLLQKGDYRESKRLEKLRFQLGVSSKNYHVTFHYVEGDTRKCETIATFETRPCTPNAEAIHATQVIHFDTRAEKEEFITGLELVAPLVWNGEELLPNARPAERERVVHRASQRKASSFDIKLKAAQGEEIICNQYKSGTIGLPEGCAQDDPAAIHATQRVDFTDETERREFLEAVKP
jgi:hypothetical protein